jgi:hypothetical protein
MVSRFVKRTMPPGTTTLPVLHGDEALVAINERGAIGYPQTLGRFTPKIAWDFPVSRRAMREGCRGTRFLAMPIRLW